MFEVNLTLGEKEEYMDLGFVDTWVYKVLIFYHIVITLSALIGNPVILYGSFKYNAINVEETSVMFIKCLAVTDILILMSSAIPILTTLLAKRWVLGPVICFFHSYFIFVPGISQNLIILMISCYKLRYITKPFSVPPSGTATRNSMIGVYMFAVLYSLVAIPLADGAEFSLPDLSCIPKFENLKIKIYSSLGIVLLNFVPSVTMFIVNILILLQAHAASKKHGDRLSLKSLVFISTIAWIYIISSIPKGVRYVLQALGQEPSLWLGVIQKEVYFLNISSNWIVYSITNRDFRRFLRRLASLKLKDHGRRVGSKQGPNSVVLTNTTVADPSTTVL